MHSQRKKKAAIVAGVYAYMQAEQAVAPEEEPAAEGVTATAYSRPSAWSWAGRKDIMDRRYYLQFRFNR